MSVVVGLVYFKLSFDQSSMRDRFGMMYILGALYPYMVVLDLIGICKQPLGIKTCSVTYNFYFYTLEQPVSLLNTQCNTLTIFLD